MSLNHLHNRNGEDANLNLKVARWIGSLIAGDEKGGRSQSEFPVSGLDNKIDKDMKKRRQQGVAVFKGGGNIFFSVNREGVPVILHSRAFAQRVVRLRFI